jgi:hypothetical protein
MNAHADGPPADGTETEDVDTGNPEAAASEADGPPETAEEAQKRKFREALERKSGGKGGSADGHGESKVHGAQGPAKSQRTFRRKSGG